MPATAQPSLALDLLRRGCRVLWAGRACLRLQTVFKVPEEVRAKADEFIAVPLADSPGREHRKESLQRGEHLEEELLDFVEHCRKSPGRAYKAPRETMKQSVL